MARFLIALLLGFFGISASAAEEKSIYYVGVNDAEFRPFSWMEEGQLQGADRAVLDAFARYRKVHLVYLPLPRHRALELLKSGGIDLIYPDDRYWNSDPKQALGLELHYSEAAVTNQSGFFELKRSSCRSDIASIGSLLGWMPIGYRERIEAGEVRLRRFATLEQMLAAGLVGDVDAIYSERQFLEAYIERHPRYSSLVFCEQLPSRVGRFRLSTLRQTQLLAEFNQFLQDKPGVIADIRALYRLP